VKEADKDLSAIRRWWNRLPDSNLGVATGAASGIVVIDVDGPAGEAALRELNLRLPPTLEAATGRGRHIFLAAPSGAPSKTFSANLSVRGDGYYVVAPPSLHVSGKRYSWANSLPIAPAPAELLALLNAPTASIAAAADDRAGDGTIPDGTRKRTLLQMAMGMAREGHSRANIEEVLCDVNRRRCNPPLSARDVERAVCKGCEYVARHRQERQMPLAPTKVNSPTVDRRESAATILVEFAQSNAELFHFGESCFATIQVNDHLETFPIRSHGFRCWLTRLYFAARKRALSGDALGSALTTLEGFARFEGEERPVHVRAAGHGGSLYLDLGNQSWGVVEISATGSKLIGSKESPVRFRRPHGMSPLPMTEAGGQFDELRSLLNIGSRDDFVLIAGWLIGALHPEGPYPILILHGEQGSSKTTVARMLRGLIDPNFAPLRSEPREPRDLMIAANNGLVCAFDNLSSMPVWFSDALCRLSTGGGFSTRALYTDQDEIVFDAKRPIILTGIEEIANRGDLLDRALIIYLPRIPEGKCKPEHRLNQAYELARPRLLGALLNGVSAALANIHNVTLPHLPRMADFAVWVTAAERGLGWKPGEFTRAYDLNRRAANELPLETPVVDALRKLDLPWTGTATNLLAELEPFADERTRRMKSWPSSGKSLANALRRLAPNLRPTGIDVEFGQREPGTGGRLITITRKRVQTIVTTVTPSQAASKAIPVNSAGCDDERKDVTMASAHRHTSESDLEPVCDAVTIVTMKNIPFREGVLDVSDQLNVEDGERDVGDL
jgi:hypothetical protein